MPDAAPVMASRRHAHQLGVRLALGARPSAVVRMVVGQGVRATAVGAPIDLIRRALETIGFEGVPERGKSYLPSWPRTAPAG